MKHADHDAHRAFEASTLHAGCTGDCEYGEPCSCSHSALQPSRRPRQPRLPEPRTPHLPLWTRFKLWWQQWLATEVWYDGDKMTCGEMLSIAIGVVSFVAIMAASAAYALGLLS